MWSRPRSRALLVMVVLALAVASVVVLVAGGVGASPSPISSIRIGRFGEVNYYASQPMPNVPPGILVRVFLVNGSVVEPVDAFIDVYANAPNGIVHVAMGYSSILIVPFNDSNWQYVLGKWASLGIPFSEYNTSMLIFVTYVKVNESWILPLLVPYNVAWAYAALGRVTPLTATLSTIPRYIVVNALINVNELRPNKVVPVRLNSTVTDPQVFGTYYNYTIYNCSLSGPQPPQYPSAPTSLYMYQPTSDCVGINGSLPIAWVTWSNGVIQNKGDNGLSIYLNIDFSGTIDWDAMATSYGDIGTSYSASENWGVISKEFTIGSQVTQPGSLYWYYGGATWGIVNYTVYECGNINYLVKYGYCPYYNVYVGTTLVSEVLYVPPNDTNVSPVFDYGNGPISMFYIGAIPASRQYFGYPVLNASSVVDYAAFSNGKLIQCNGPVNVFSGGMYFITLGGVNTAYGLSAAELGTALVEIVLGIGSIEAAIYGTPVWLSLLLSAGSLSATIAGLLVPPSTSTTTTKTTLEIMGVTTSTSLYISVIDASKAYGLPTFGFILNATNYYGNPSSPTCNYNQVTQIG